MKLYTCLALAVAMIGCIHVTGVVSDVLLVGQACTAKEQCENLVCSLFDLDPDCISCGTGSSFCFCIPKTCPVYQPSYSTYPNTGYPNAGYGYAASGYPGTGYSGTGYSGTGYSGTGYSGTGYSGTGYPASAYSSTGYTGSVYPASSYSGSQY